MRKCGSCGYLLLGDGDSCSHCGAPVAQLAGAVPAAAPSAPTPPPRFAPPPPLPRATVPGLADAPSAPLPQFLSPGREWQPLGPSTPPRRAKRSKARIVMLAVVLALGLSIYGAVLHPGSNALPSGTSAFAKGDGVDYQSPDGSYMAQFPKTPVQSHDVEQLQGFTTTVNTASVETDDYEMATGSIALPAKPTSAQSSELLHDALNAGISKAGGTNPQETPLTRGGLPALQATFKAPDGYNAKGLVMLDGKWLFVFLVHAKTGTDKLFDALDKSFVPTALP
jgi:hypothetical protein